jgi:hypothetical protein
MKPKALATIAKEIPFEGLAGAFDSILKGAARGRVVVKIA